MFKKGDFCPLFFSLNSLSILTKAIKNIFKYGICRSVMNVFWPLFKGIEYRSEIIPKGIKTKTRFKLVLKSVIIIPPKAITRQRCITFKEGLYSL